MSKYGIILEELDGENKNNVSNQPNTYNLKPDNFTQNHIKKSNHFNFVAAPRHVPDPENQNYIPNHIPNLRHIKKEDENKNIIPAVTYNRNVDMNSIKDVINEYFDRPKVTKTANNGTASIYMAKLKTGLLLDNKYIVVISVNDSNPVGTVRNLSDIRWVSIQTRIIREEQRCNDFYYTPKRTAPYTNKIFIKERNEKYTTYSSLDFKNLTVTLLHTDNIVYSFPDTGTIAAALETYKTVLSL